MHELETMIYAIFIGSSVGILVTIASIIITAIFEDGLVVLIKSATGAADCCPSSDPAGPSRTFP